MDLHSELTDEVFLKELGSRIAAVRLSRNLTQAGLAEQAGLGLRTVQRLELGAAATQLSGFVRVCRVLGLADRFEALLPKPADSPMAQLRFQGRQRRRASGRRGRANRQKPWTWAEPS